mgnify:CR=1 FL=1
MAGEGESASLVSAKDPPAKLFIIPPPDESSPVYTTS